MFTANFDGDLDSYLDELAARLVPEAQEIWGRCIGCPQPAEGAALKAYLGRNQLQSGVVFAAYGQASVEQIRSRARQARAPGGLRRARAGRSTRPRAAAAFLKEFGS